MQKMKKKNIIGIIVAVIALIVGIIGAANVFSPYERQIRLGYKMLNEEKYEEAILAFNTAIEIEAKKDKAYIGLADTYIFKCDENVVSDINNALSEGYEQTQSENIINSYLEISEKLFDDERKDDAIELLELGYYATENDSIKDKVHEFKLIVQNEFLKHLYELCENNALDEVRNVIETIEFEEIILENYVDSPIIYKDENNESNKMLGIYNIDDERYVYFGDCVDNIRQGNGIWISFSYLYKGEWSQDKPNGAGISYEGDSESRACRIKGNVVNGFWNGTIIHDDVYDGEEYLYKIVEYDNGIVTSESDEDGPVEGWEEYYDGMPHGILGFAERGWS